MDRCATFLQTCLGGYRFGKNTRISYRMDENELMIAVPRAAIGLKQDGFELHFQWADHTGKNETIADFYEHGDTAPYGRFSYIYRAE